MAEQDDGTPQPEPAKLVEAPRITITVLPDQNLDINVNDVTPVTMIGAAEILKNMGLAMITAAQASGLVVPQKGITLDHLGKGGRRPS